jgi:hypothetical protein
VLHTLSICFVVKLKHIQQSQLKPQAINPSEHNMSSAISPAAAAAASLAEEPEEPVGEELNTPMEVDPTVGASPTTEPVANTPITEKQVAATQILAAQPVVADPPASDDNLDSDDVSPVPLSMLSFPNSYRGTQHRALYSLLLPSL